MSILMHIKYPIVFPATYEQINTLPIEVYTDFLVNLAHAGFTYTPISRIWFIDLSDMEQWLIYRVLKETIFNIDE